MEIKTNVEGTKATISVTGKLTVATSPELEEAVRKLNDESGVIEYDMELSELEYISSAGLRVLVATQKLSQRKGGTMRLLHPTDDVMDVLEMTGLSEVLTVER